MWDFISDNSAFFVVLLSWIIVYFRLIKATSMHYDEQKKNIELSKRIETLQRMIRDKEDADNV